MIIQKNREWKKDQIAAARYNERFAGLTLTDGTFLRTDAQTRADIFWGQAQSKDDPAWVFQNWKMPDGTFADIPAALVLQFAAAIEQLDAALFAKEKSLCGAIDAATTPEELNAIVW